MNESSQIEKLSGMLYELADSIRENVFVSCEAGLQAIDEFLMTAPFGGSCLEALKWAVHESPSSYATHNWRIRQLLGIAPDNYGTRVFDRDVLTLQDNERTAFANTIKDIANRMRSFRRIE
jgi:hypothetical protein